METHMPLSFGLRWNVVQFLKACSPQEQDAFNLKLREIRANPQALIRDTDLVVDRKLSRYVLRSFEFADCTAVLGFIPAHNYIEALECHRPNPKSKRHEGSSGDK